jgi:hypothetical protein
VRRLQLVFLLLLALSAAALTACGDDEADSGPVSTVAAGEELTVTGARSTLAVDGITAGVLKGGGVTIEPIEPAASDDASISIPIIDGEITTGTLAGSIDHEGGIAFRANGRRIVYEDLRVDTVAEQVYSGAGTRTPVFDLDMRSMKSLEDGGAILIRDVVASFTAPAAKELNAGLGVSAFVPAQILGKLTMRVTGS